MRAHLLVLIDIPWSARQCSYDTPLALRPHTTLALYPHHTLFASPSHSLCISTTALSLTPAHSPLESSLDCNCHTRCLTQYVREPVASIS